MVLEMADFLAGGRVPDHGALIVAGRNHAIAVGTEGCETDFVKMFQWRGHGLASGGIPDPGRVIGAGGHDPLAVGAEFAMVNRPVMPHDRR